MGNKTKAYAVTISGSYHNSKGEEVDFLNLKGVIPMTASEEMAVAMVRTRYVQMWIKADPKAYPERLSDVRECYIDDIQETEAEFSFMGKNITDMSYEELQDLATAKDLRGIPLFRDGSLRTSQGRAYAEYSNKVLGVDVNWREEGYNVMKMPPIIVDGTPKKTKEKKLTNEDIIQKEQDSTSTDKPEFTRPELEKLAKENSISFNPSITDEALKRKVFGGE